MPFSPRTLARQGSTAGNGSFGVSRSQAERYVYLVNDDTVERWPSSTFVSAEQRVGMLVLCA